jgi:hypothetical protein
LNSSGRTEQRRGVFLRKEATGNKREVQGRENARRRKTRLIEGSDTRVGFWT